MASSKVENNNILWLDFSFFLWCPIHAFGSRTRRRLLDLGGPASCVNWSMVNGGDRFIFRIWRVSDDNRIVGSAVKQIAFGGRKENEAFKLNFSTTTWCQCKTIRCIDKFPGMGGSAYIIIIIILCSSGGISFWLLLPTEWVSDFVGRAGGLQNGEQTSHEQQMHQKKTKKIYKLHWRHKLPKNEPMRRRRRGSSRRDPLWNNTCISNTSASPAAFH